MIKIEREKPKGDRVEGTLKNFAINSEGQFFLIFHLFEKRKIPAKKGGKDVTVDLDFSSGKELIVNLNKEETYLLRKFLVELK